MTTAQTTAARLRTLARTDASKVADRIVAPLTFALSAQVEAWPLQDYLSDPTKLARGLTGLNQALGSDVIWSACAGGIEVQALGADLDWSAYPPTVVPGSAAGKTIPAALDRALLATPRIAASLEVTRRLAATTDGQPAICAALTGIGTLSAQITQAGLSVSDEPGAVYALAGRIALTLMKGFLEAGAQGLILIEQAMPAPASPEFEAWKRALTPMNNTAGFFKVLFATVLDTGDREPEPQIAALPPWLKICLAPQNESRPRGRIGDAISTDPAQIRLSTDGPFLTTLAEVPADADISQMRQAWVPVSGA